MAPKRKSNESKNISKTTIKRRFSKRLSNMISSDESVVNKTKSSRNKRDKKKTNKSKSFFKKTKERDQSDETDDGLIIDENANEEHSNSMSVGSDSGQNSNEATSSSMDHSLTNDTQLKPSTYHSSSINDEDEEFRRLFMTVTPKSNCRNYNSTPLCITRKNDKNNQSVANSSTTQYVKDTPPSRLSLNTNSGVNVSTLNSKTINTTFNSNVLDVAPQSQSSSSVKSLSSFASGSSNFAILETFPEYRKLKRDFEQAKKQNEQWAKDFQTLTNRMKQLEQTTFPRPTADGFAFLEQLLLSLKSSRRDEDTRSNAELARDFGLTEATLMSLSNTDPQKTSLHLFNALFPTYEEKEALINVAHLKILHPNLLDNILVFARRCSPGCGYNISMLKEAVGNSIRCARHRMRRNNAHHIVVAAAAVNQPQMQFNDDFVEHNE